jgi:hypothetical protein
MLSTDVFQKTITSAPCGGEHKRKAERLMEKAGHASKPDSKQASSKQQASKQTSKQASKQASKRRTLHGHPPRYHPCRLHPHGISLAI